jgi:hypothetical protein
MRWVARHCDGYCSRLLIFTLSVHRGIAQLEASWARPEPSSDEFRTQFEIDESRIEGLLPKLRNVNEQDSEFDLCTDLSSNTLIIKGAHSHQESEFFGGGCFEEFPPFREFFAWLQEQVIAQLPLAKDADTGPFN